MKMRVLATATLIAVCSAGSAIGQDTRGALRDACLEDYKRLCTAVTRGGGRIRKCMMDNSDKLSPQCKSALGGGPRPY